MIYGVLEKSNIMAAVSVQPATTQVALVTGSNKGIGVRTVVFCLILTQSVVNLLSLVENILVF